MAAAFTAVAIGLGLSGRVMDDEAGLAWMAVRAFLNDPLPVLFFQKFHPTNVLLLAPATLAGWPGYIVFHALLGGATVLAIAGATRRLGGSAVVAALVLASSSPFLVSAATGQSNTGGLFLFSLALWLALGGPRARLAAGLLLGSSLWARYELLPLAAGLALFLGIHRRDRRALLATTVFPVLYLLAGAAWHGDPLWALRLPPAVPELIPKTLEHGIPTVALGRAAVVSFLGAMAVVTPAWILAFLGFGRDRGAEARWIGGFCLVGLAAMVVLPLMGQTFNFEFVPRYLMVLLPGLAIGAGLAARSLPGRGVVAFVVLAGAGLGAALLERPDHPELAVAIGLPFLAAATWAVASGRLRLPAGILIGAMLAISTWLMAPTPDSFGRPFAAWRPELARAVSARMEPGRRVITNVHLLAWSMDAPDRPGRVRFLPGYDMLYELWRLLDHGNGQDARVIRAVEGDLFGGALWPCQAARLALEPGDLLVFSDDRRAEVVGPVAAWKRHATVVDRVGPIEILRVDQAVPPVAAAPLPDWLDPAVVTSTCPERPETRDRPGTGQAR